MRLVDCRWQDSAAFLGMGLIQEAFVGVVRTATLWGMDSVRFGRALGVGARAAAKTLVTAVDAATAPNPSAPAPASTSANAGASSTVGKTDAATTGARLGQQAARTTSQVRQTGK